MFLSIIYFPFPLCVYMGRGEHYIHECRRPRRPEASDSLKLELQALVSHLAWVLGIKRKTSGRVVHALNHGAISLFHRLVFKDGADRKKITPDI